MKNKQHYLPYKVNLLHRLSAHADVRAYKWQLDTQLSLQRKWLNRVQQVGWLFSFVACYASDREIWSTNSQNLRHSTCQHPASRYTICKEKKTVCWFYAELTITDSRGKTLNSFKLRGKIWEIWMIDTKRAYEKHLNLSTCHFFLISKCYQLLFY